MFKLNDKAALVTGASGGIGGAIARSLHAQGATVVLAGRREDALKKLADELGERAHIAVAELGDADSAKDLATKAEELAGPIHILVNNAGLTRDNLALRLKDEDWDEVLRVNLGAAFRLSRALLRGMMKARWGRIINITSVVGTMGQAGQSNYAAAKAGLVGMSKSLAQEVASRNITVNCLAPGFITTPMTEALDESRQQAIAAAIPAARFGAPRDIAAGALFLASDEAGYITGQTLHINGGLAMI